MNQNVKRLIDWLRKKGEQRNLIDIAPFVLDQLMAGYLIEMKKDGVKRSMSRRQSVVALGVGSNTSVKTIMAMIYRPVRYFKIHEICCKQNKKT